MSQPYPVPPLQVSPDNPFKESKPKVSGRNYYEPGTPWWWLQRLSQKLMDRYERFDVLERYALGDHPLPNTDYRYVKALKDLQAKARTNYCNLVISAVVERMKVKGFRFGPAGKADTEAKLIWDYNDMDYQSPINLSTAATFGLCYALVGPPDPSDPDGQPSICIEDPRMCVTERDPYRITRSLAGLKLWQDDTVGLVVAALYLPDGIYMFATKKYADQIFDSEAALTKQFSTTPSSAGFEFVEVLPNPLGEVPLVEGNWQPAFGDLGRAEHEGVLDIQDRINHTFLDRLVVAKSQAYRQRWATGLAPPGKKGAKRPPFDPGADILWVTPDPQVKFGEFETADLTKIQNVIEADIGHLAAITKTPATYLMNRMVNVSGDTLTQDQSGLVMKTKTREESMGWFYERVMKLAFKYKNDERYKTVEASTLWSDPEIRTLAEKADALNKLVTAGVPLEIAMEELGYSPDQIEFAIQKKEQEEEAQRQREDAQAAQQQQFVIEQQRVKAVSAGSGASSTSARKPSSSK